MRERAPRRLLALVAAGCVIGGCVSAPTATLDDTPLAVTSTTVVERRQGALEIGQASRTALGNTVAVLDVDVSTDGPDGTAMDVLVEACAAPGATEEVGVSLGFFRVALRDGTLIEPIEPSDAREPALRTHRLPAGSCAVGWLTFEPPESPEAVAVVFGSRTSLVPWALE